MDRTSSSSPAQVLFENFEDDHRTLTQGLSELLARLRACETEDAVRLADDLDCEGGSHIKFEEDVFYPSLRSDLGSDFVDQLYREHESGRLALARLLGLSAEERKAVGAERRRWAEVVVAQLEVALEHALSCGTLLSHLESLGDEELKEMNETLLAMKEQDVRWTDRPSLSAS